MTTGKSANPEWPSLFSSTGLLLLRDSADDAKRAVLVAPARDISTDLVNQVINISGGGLFFVALSRTQAESLLLGPMRRPQTSSLHTSNPHLLPWLVSCDARNDVTTGISAADRAVALRVLGAPDPNPRDLVKPGHIFPVEVATGGLLVKSGLAEGAFDAVRIAGGHGTALFVDLLDEDGELMNETQQDKLAAERQIPLLTLDQLTRYRLENEALVERVAEASMPTQRGGALKAIMYRSHTHSGEHIAFVKGPLDSSKPVLTRVQPEFTFGDVFGGHTPPTRTTLHAALESISEAPQGVLVYLRRTTSGQLAQQLSDWSTDYHNRRSSMMRQYGLGAQILHDLGVKKIRLMSNSDGQLPGLEAFGMEIVGREAVTVPRR